MNAVIGVGNPDRGDDAAGREVARRLRLECPQDVTVMECEGILDTLLDAWRGAERAVVVDAVTGPAPGRIHRFDAVKGPLPAAFASTSTHGLGLAEAIELARALNTLPDRLVVYAIEGRSFALGAPISPEVDRAIERVLALVVQEMEVGRV